MRESMNRTLKLEEELKGVHSIGIAGHIRPDGDAVKIIRSLQCRFIWKIFQSRL